MKKSLNSLPEFVPLPLKLVVKALNKSAALILVSSLVHLRWMRELEFSISETMRFSLEDALAPPDLNERSIWVQAEKIYGFEMTYG